LVKGLILSGGAGTRLRPITYTSAKQLVPIANKPILFYGIEAMADAGINEIGIIVGDTGAEVRAAVGDGSRFGVEVSYIAQEAPLGLAHCVLIASEFLAEDPFVMYLGDNMLEEGLAGFIDGFAALSTIGEERPAAQLLLAEVDNPSAFGVAELDDGGMIVRLVEKPKEPRSNLALVGVYIFDHRIHQAVRAITPSARGELEITDAIQHLIDTGLPVHHQLLRGWWIDTGKKDPLLECNRLVLDTISTDLRGSVDESSRIEGRVVLAEGASVRSSIIRGPAVIGAGTTIERTHVGPYTAIGEDCTVIETEVDNSVLLAGSSVVGVERLTESLIGRGAEITASTQRPRAARVMVGDDSKVELPSWQP
jgi:glucose-1-phosphate thymidylyltransferase